MTPADDPVLWRFACEIPFGRRSCGPTPLGFVVVLQLKAGAVTRTDGECATGAKGVEESPAAETAKVYLPTAAGSVAPSAPPP
jgi:hypothetical protein